MVLTKVKIGEFDQFWSVFSTKGAALRRVHGSKGARVLRNAEDPNEVWVLFDWERERFEQFLSDPKAREVMGEAGLQRPPEPVFVDAAGEVDS